MELELKIERDSEETNVRYVRSPRQWVKITRRADEKRWYFARGYTGEVKAHDLSYWPFKHLATWQDAIDHAKQQIKDYE